MSIVKMFLMFGILLSFSSFAQEDEQGALEKILTHDHFCVKRYGKSKVYLREDRIYPTEQGMFVFLSPEGESTALPKLLSNTKGCYVEYARVPDHSVPDHYIPSPCQYLNYKHKADVSHKVTKICSGCKKEYWNLCATPSCVEKRKADALQKKQLEKERAEEERIKRTKNR